MVDPIRYIFEGRACRVAGEHRTNNMGGRSGSHSAWYTLYSVRFAGQDNSEHIPAGQFNGKARCGCCGKKVCGACKCRWDQWNPGICLVHELMTGWTEQNSREAL
jgi:hypothetical protein